jgi:hypothetical protein
MMQEAGGMIGAGVSMTHEPGRTSLPAVRMTQISGHKAAIPVPMAAEAGRTAGKRGAASRQSVAIITLEALITA